MSTLSTKTTFVVVIAAIMAALIGCGAQRDTDEHATPTDTTVTLSLSEKCDVTAEENGNFTVVATFSELRKSTMGTATVELTSQSGQPIEIGDAYDGQEPGDWDLKGPGTAHVTFTKVDAPQEAATTLTISGHTDGSSPICTAKR